MKVQADNHRREISFEVGDYVYLKLQPYQQRSVAFRSSNKLSPYFYGPFRILARIGTVAYKLELPVESLIHDVVHVSLLKKQLGTDHIISPQLPTFADSSSILPQPEMILDRRVIQKGRYRPRQEILVKWIGSPTADATWENQWRFAKSYPHFDLADKDIPRGVE